MWASDAPTRPSVTARVVADAPVSTRASRWQAADRQRLCVGDLEARPGGDENVGRWSAVARRCRPARGRGTVRLVSNHHRTDGASVTARPRSDGNARHGTAWSSAGTTMTMSWAVNASGSTRRRSSSSTASRAARRRPASTAVPAPLVRVVARPRKAAVARSAALRISAIGPNPTTAEWRRVITTATSSPPAPATDTSSRPPSASRSSPSRNRVAGASAVCGDSRIHRSCNDRSSPAWRERSSSDGDPSSSARVSSTATDRNSASSSATAGRHARHRRPRERGSGSRPLHPREQVPRAGIIERDPHREVDHVAGVHLDGGSGVRSAESHTVAFEGFEGGDEMTPRRGIVADRPRRHRRRVPRDGDASRACRPARHAPRRRPRTAWRHRSGGDRWRPPWQVTARRPLHWRCRLPPARWRGPRDGAAPTSRAGGGRSPAGPASARARRPAGGRPIPSRRTPRGPVPPLRMRAVGSPSSRAAWARSSHASAVVARSPSAPSRRKASSASSRASADRPADSSTSARDTSGSDASWPSRRKAWQFSSRIVSACGSCPRFAAVQARLWRTWRATNSCPASENRL